MDGEQPGAPEPQEPGDGYPRRREVRGREAGPAAEERRSPWRKRVVIALVAVLVVGGALAAVATWRLSSNITRVDVSEALGTDRPTRAPQATEAVNLLLIGSDNRTGKGNTSYGTVAEDPGVHSDTNLLVHLSADRTWAMVVSIPRDSMTKAPPECSPTAPKNQWVTRQWNHNFKIGGTGCLIRTLEGDTGVFVDHYAVVDFNGFKQMVEALGGVEVCTTEPIDDANSTLKLSAGTHKLSGEQALAYVRTRKSLGDGSDLGRIKRQQAFLSSVAQEATSSRLLFQPTRLYSFLDAATKSLTTDPRFGLGTMKDLAESVRGIGLDNVEFLTVPTEPFPADTNRVQWQDSADAVWEAIREDRRIGERPKASPGPSASDAPLTVSPADISVEVVNGAGTTGLAGQAAEMLRVQGFTVTGTDNRYGADRGTLVEYSAGQEEAARTVAAAFPRSRLEKAAGLGRTIRVTMGPGARNVVEVPNRTGSAPLPKPSVTAAAPTPSASPSIDSRTAAQDICKTS
ncbi:LCP family protein [Phycicoccus flavus]|uniref:LCP family protein n=1 Tax=Phycicoccus flavus TaxID=2502783 RepID=A0A8T6QZ05_9MICO|nr:LCP family protein [Phycicoccus flavus]NHA66766.1 LCP family protein [Phycicoccus flavus]